MTEVPFASLTVPKDWDRRGLPAWTYRSQAMFDLEREEIFLRHWQVAGHTCDIPAPGDWLSFDLLGERAVVMRGQDGVVRAFHNLCRHRGARVVQGDKGHCKGAVVCPFHGWVYNLDGTLRGAAVPTSFGAMDRAKFGLKPIELEVFHGFILLRFNPGPQPGAARPGSFRRAERKEIGGRVNLDLRINARQIIETADVVVMPVRNNRNINLSQINFQSFQILLENPRVRSRIEQNHFALVIDNTSEPEILCQAFAVFAERIINIRHRNTESRSFYLQSNWSKKADN